MLTLQSGRFLLTNVHRLSLENVVVGLDRVVTGDMLSRMDFFFEIHCSPTSPGSLSREDVQEASESLLFLTRHEGEAAGGCQSKFHTAALQMMDTESTLERSSSKKCVLFLPFLHVLTLSLQDERCTADYA